MAMNFLEIAQAVVTELGLPYITDVADNTAPGGRQLYALINRAGDEIYQAHPWVVSQEQHIVEIGIPLTTTGDVTAGSGLVTNIPDTSSIVAEQFAVSGNGLQQSTRVAEVIDANTVRVDQYATDSGTGVDLIFARDTYSVPAEFKWFANRTMWDRTNHWELVGPMSPQGDQWQRSGIVTIGPRKRWRQVGPEMNGQVPWRLWPAPTATGSYPATLVFEYNSRYWAADENGDRKEKLTANTDYPVIDAQAIILHAKWRLWQVKGFEYGAMQAEAIDYVNRLAARDGGSPDLSLSKRRDTYWLLGPQNIQDGAFPGPGNPV